MTQTPEPPLLVSELAEVYLLLDNISAVASKALPDLSAEPIFSGSSKTWLEQVNEIRWPPTPGTPQPAANEAAKLIRVRDVLNNEAWPASGASIAFSLIVAGETGGMSSPLRALWRRVAGQREEATPPPPDPRDRLGVDAPSRRSLAALAYPILSGRQRLYRRIYDSLNWMMPIALFAACFTSWRVETGTALLRAVDGAFAQSGVFRTDVAPETVSVMAQDRRQASSEDRAPALNRSRALSNLRLWMEDQRYLPGFIGADKELPSLRDGTKQVEANLEWARVLIGVLVGSVLPFFYGLLGATAAVVRSNAAKMRASTLVPRDLMLGWVQVGLGAVLGLCVGLFVAPRDGDAGGNLFDTGHLSLAALSFLAGFGVEGVFRALEVAIARVFPVGPPTAPVRPTRPGPLLPPK